MSDERNFLFVCLCVSEKYAGKKCLQIDSCLTVCVVKQPAPPACELPASPCQRTPSSLRWHTHLLTSLPARSLGERPWPFFKDRNCRKTVFATFDCPMRGLQDAHTVQKVRPICPQHGRGSPGDWDSRESPWKKTYDNIGQTYDIVCQHTMSMFNTISYVTLRYRIPDILY
jgi:hypothetical protein